MNIMKRWLVGFSMLAVLAVNCAAAEWLTDVHAALDKAAAENKVVLLDFTGSDWCGWCMKFKGEVLDQPEFAAFAQAHLVLVEVDFPHHKPQSAEQAEANQALGRNYKVGGYPTFLLVDSMAKELWRQTGYRPGGPKSFIAELEKVPGVGHTDPAVAEKPEAAPKRSEPKFVPIAPLVPTKYGELTLKGISGGKDRRMALINNETFMAGETGNVKVQDGRVEIICNEVREDSVLITVDGKQRELKLAEH